MITVGEIINKKYDENNTLIYDVKLDIFKNPGNHNEKLSYNIFEATCSTLPGIYEPYNVGDIVYVSFVNNKMSLPVVIGKVHKRIPPVDNPSGSSFGYFKTLQVDNKALLPKDTKFGDVSANQIKLNMMAINNLQSMIPSGGGGSTIDSISVNGTQIEPVEGNVDITVPTTLDDISDGSTRKLSNYLPRSGGSSNPLTAPVYVNHSDLSFIGTAGAFGFRAAALSGQSVPHLGQINLSKNFGGDGSQYGIQMSAVDITNNKFNQFRVYQEGIAYQQYDNSSGTTTNVFTVDTAGALKTLSDIYEGGTLDDNKLSNKYLGKTAKAADSDKLDGQAASYYLNYNNLSNTPTIPTKTSELTNDSGFITSSDVPKELYWCTYGTTTYSDVYTAVSNGKLPVCKYGDPESIYVFSTISSGQVVFSCVNYASDNIQYKRLRVSSANSWFNYTVYAERNDNKVTSISSSSTDTQYPSAKCVYDNINTIKTNLTPTLANQSISANNKFTFTNVTFDSIGVFTFGNCSTFINLYGLQVGVTYKQTGTFVYNTSGSVVTTTINIKRPSGTTDTIEIYSGNDNFSIVDGYTGYLFKVKLG